ncbi:hypothetical protein MiAbW_02049 [Microcystis aeruginosa NIES-4325]|uniref:Uncharacterized protein n=1 Tax=Microcystis aeruginosa NIES-4325 TaxID=2569534 RepID=A0A5J4F9Z8_MICAE|nr:hypothetical protein MiAbW_02049 [Microcystis aeruginosa NIES-4325]
MSAYPNQEINFVLLLSYLYIYTCLLITECN